MRKLVTIQVIESITPIPDADRIETARVKGWNIVVQKGEFAVGEKIAYFEVDSFLPEDVPAYENFQVRGQKELNRDGQEVKGHVVKTIKLRGVVSQGLIMGLNTLGIPNTYDVDTDITEMVNVLKYEEPIPVSGEIIGPFDTRWAPKSDAIRVQTLADHWNEIVNLDWEATVKVDGTSQTLVNDNGNLRIFSRNWELTNESAGFKIAERFGLIDVLEKNLGMSIQFELAGPGIQKNRLKLNEQRPFVFAIWMNGQKLNRTDWPQEVLEVSAPLLNEEWKPNGSLDEMISKVAELKGSVTKDVRDEGIVFHIVGNPPEWMDRNANFKIISNGYLLKHGI